MREIRVDFPGDGWSVQSKVIILITLPLGLTRWKQKNLATSAMQGQSGHGLAFGRKVKLLAVGWGFQKL